jgi:uncharacterized protein YkwD
MIKVLSLFLILLVPLMSRGQESAQAGGVQFDKDEMLKRVNEARSESRLCGQERQEATHEVGWDKKLTRAAKKHANDMEENQFFDHTGSDGSTVVLRVEREEYIWRAVGENVAQGPRTVSDAMKGWLESPGHCRNIMNPDFREMGAAVSDDGKYWVQVFAAPR